MGTPLQNFNRDFVNACESLGRDPESITLIAVSKYTATAQIRAMAAEGQCHFGERRMQEAAPKIAELSDLRLTWHFIGPLQANKAASVAKAFDVLHSVDRLPLARRLNRVLKDLGQTRAAFLQVNLWGESTKSGFNRQALLETLPALLELRALKWLGLMALPPPSDDPVTRRNTFHDVADLQQACNALFGTTWRSLSLGMSDDWREALAEGATHLRVGRVLFP